MANYYGQERTNYFKVKDVEAFKIWAGKFRFELFERGDMFAMAPSDRSDDGCFTCWTDDGDEDDNPDFMTELSAHLAEGQIAVMVGCGAEKIRYICGYAIAVDHAGKMVSVDISSIYQIAAAAFSVPESQITRAEY